MSRKRKRTTMPPVDFIGAPDIRVQRGDVVVDNFVEDGCKGLRKRHKIDRLARYARRNVINRMQHAAGIRFIGDAEACEVSIPSLLDDRACPGSGEGSHIAVAERGAALLDAQRNLGEAIRAIGMQLSPIVIAVCIQNVPADEWAKRAKLPVNDGAALLRAGLQALVRFYHLDK